MVKNLKEGECMANLNPGQMGFRNQRYQPKKRMQQDHLNIELATTHNWSNIQ